MNNNDNEYCVSRFQAVYLAKLIELLEKGNLKFSVVFHSITGNSYFLASTEIFKFYIYLDGADFIGGGIDERFESEDYKNLDELGSEFISAVKRNL